MRKPEYLKLLWDEFNESEFGGKLHYLPLLCKRFSQDSKHGQIVWVNRNGHHKALSLEISDDIFSDEDLLQGTVLHEMIHVYQCQVLNRKPNHDAIFCSIARKLERKYGIEVR